MTMKLHGFPGTRSNQVRWMLEEVGAPYEFVHVELLKGAHKSPEYLAKYPHGRVPYFEDGDNVVFESCAALLYLADKFPEKKLAPPVDGGARAAYYQWIVYSAATLDKPVIDTYFHKVVLPEDKRKPEVVAEHQPVLAAALRILEPSLAGQAYVLGERFSAADIAIGYSLNLIDKAGSLIDAPGVAAYLARVRERPAFKTVYE